MTPTIRNRIKDHRRVRAGDLVPHELNPRRHPDAQREALAALYAEIGFARSLLAYELPDGRLKLLDGHLRQSLEPDLEVDVEVLDVSDDEARKLLLSLDPLAQLADYDHDTLAALRAITQSEAAALQNLWSAIGQAGADTAAALARAARTPAPGPDEPPADQYLLIIDCQGEQEQLDLLRRFRKEGLSCQAKIA